jgi:FAD/FMN-containing dehydrogenase
MSEISGFLGELGPIECTTDERSLRVKSRDWFSVSPMLRTMLEGKRADAIVTPHDKTELLHVIATAAKHRLPLTLRGGGTANYGQSVPLRGGVLLDMTAMAGVLWTRPGEIRAQAGTIVADMEAAARDIGWEMRMVPTTKLTATIGGFVAGGTGGIGSAAWGVLRDRGNITAVEVISMEEVPRIIELRGRDARLVHHAYGTNGIISEIEMPLVPMWDWIETIVAFPDYMQTVKFGVKLGNEHGIVKKLLSIQEWPTPRLIQPLGDIVPDGHSMISSIVSNLSMRDFEELVEEHGGKLVSACREGQGAYAVPMNEFAFGHALRQVQKSDPRRTSVEGFFQSDDLVGLVDRVHRKVDGMGPMRMELRRWGGALVGSGSPYVVFEDDAQMARLVELMQSEGVSVANPHTSSVRSVGKKELTDRDVGFKREMDPYGLLNPGRFEADSTEDETFSSTLPTDSWMFRQAS